MIITLLYDALCVTKFAHNLLSIGQLVDSGYIVEFDEKVCNIEDKKNKQQNTRIHMTQIKIFLLNIYIVHEKVLMVKKISKI